MDDADEVVLIVERDPEYAVYENAVAQAYSRNTDSFPFLLSGCLYEESGQKIDLSERFGGFENDHYISDNSTQMRLDGPQTYTRLSGKSIYLGHLMYPYGHFLVETLSSFWYLLKENEFDYYVFHPFVETGKRPEYITICFDLFNLDTDKIFVVDDPVVLERVIVPERLIKLNHSANRSVMDVYQYLTDSIVENTDMGGWDRSMQRFYLSRRHNSRKKISRSVVNESFMETLFLNNGFCIVYPEEFGFKEQVRIFKHAEVVAGLSGTALHNCLFMQSSATLIEIGDARSETESHPMQRICCKLSGVNHIFVPFRGVVLNRKHNISVVNIKNVFVRLFKGGYLKVYPSFFTGMVKKCLMTVEVSLLVFLRLAKGSFLSLIKKLFGSR